MTLLRKLSIGNASLSLGQAPKKLASTYEFLMARGFFFLLSYAARGRYGTYDTRSTFTTGSFESMDPFGRAQAGSESTETITKPYFSA